MIRIFLILRNLIKIKKTKDEKPGEIDRVTENGNYKILLKIYKKKLSLMVVFIELKFMIKNRFFILIIRCKNKSLIPTRFEVKKIFKRTIFKIICIKY